jgi:hypothetical protein
MALQPGVHAIQLTRLMAISDALVGLAKEVTSQRFSVFIKESRPHFIELQKYTALAKCPCVVTVYISIFMLK